MHVGGELAQKDDFSATLTRGDFAENLKSLPASLKFRPGNRGPLSGDGAKMRQCKSGELRRLATVSRPDTRAGLAKVASRIKSRGGSDVYRSGNGVAKSGGVDVRNALSPVKWGGYSGEALDDMRKMGEKMHCGAMSVVDWWDAVSGDQSAGGKCRLGYVIGPMSSSVTGPFRTLQRSPKLPGN